MALAEKACACTKCGTLADRVLATPTLYTMTSERRKALTINERSAHEPKRKTAGTTENGKTNHKANCSCCSSSKSKKSSTVQLPDGSKTFPKKRSWMISH